MRGQHLGSSLSHFESPLPIQIDVDLIMVINFESVKRNIKKRKNSRIETMQLCFYNFFSPLAALSLVEDIEEIGRIATEDMFRVARCRG
jgi:hypothetical protein